MSVSIHFGVYVIAFTVQLYTFFACVRENSISITTETICSYIYFSEHKRRCNAFAFDRHCIGHKWQEHIPVESIIYLVQCFTFSVTCLVVIWYRHKSELWVHAVIGYNKSIKLFECVQLIHRLHVTVVFLSFDYFLEISINICLYRSASPHSRKHRSSDYPSHWLHLLISHALCRRIATAGPPINIHLTNATHQAVAANQRNNRIRSNVNAK